MCSSDLTLAQPLCDSLRLPLLTLENLPNAPHVPLELPAPVLLHMTVTSSPLETECIGLNTYLKNEACFRYIAKHAHGRKFHNSYPQMRKAIVEEYFQVPLLLKGNFSHLFLSPSLEGMSGCLGERSPLLSSGTNRTLQEVSFSKLSTVFSTVFSTMKNTVRRLEE